VDHEPSKDEHGGDAPNASKDDGLTEPPQASDEEPDEQDQEHEGDEGDQGDDESADDAIKRQVEEAVERFDPQPGVTAPLDHVRDDEKDIEPAGVMPAAGPEGTAGEPTEGEPTED
jgi:hypothetical protein